MADRLHSHLWIMRLVYLCLCITMMFLHLLPQDTSARSWAGPDLVLALSAAWVLRRPEFVPMSLIAVVFLMTDLLYQMAPGLWAGLVVIGTEALRARAPGLRDLSFAAEWSVVAVTLTAMTIGYQLILFVTVAERPPLDLNLMQLVMTLAAYPLVVIASQIIFGVRKQSHGDLDTLVNRR